jgi:hypothetical protein
MGKEPCVQACMLCLLAVHLSCLNTDLANGVEPAIALPKSALSPTAQAKVLNLKLASSMPHLLSHACKYFFTRAHAHEHMCTTEHTHPFLFTTPACSETSWFELLEPSFLLWLLLRITRSHALANVFRF